MRPALIPTLGTLLTVLALGALAAQIAIVVATAVEVAGPGVPPRGVVYAALVVGALASGQVVLLAVGRLLSMVRRDAIFDEHAFGWVDVISVAGLTAALLVGGLCVHAGEVDDSPGLGGIGLGIGVAGVAFVLLMTVMRGLLRRATVQRHELDQVV